MSAQKMVISVLLRMQKKGPRQGELKSNKTSNIKIIEFPIRIMVFLGFFL